MAPHSASPNRLCNELLHFASSLEGYTMTQLFGECLLRMEASMEATFRDPAELQRAHRKCTPQHTLLIDPAISSSRTCGYILLHTFLELLRLPNRLLNCKCILNVQVST